MVHVFTHKRFLGDRKVIYEPEDYFKTRVVESVRQGLYELSAETKALIASEGVTKLEKDSITTKYGDMKLEDIASILDENVNTVKSRLYRSLKKLRGILEER